MGLWSDGGSNLYALIWRGRGVITCGLGNGEGGGACGERMEAGAVAAVRTDGDGNGAAADGADGGGTARDGDRDRQCLRTQRIAVSVVRQGAWVLNDESCADVSG